MNGEHVVATSAAHILQFSTTLIARLVRLPIRARDRSPCCSSVERFVHGETPGFGGPDVTPRACSTRGGPFQAEPLTPRRLHLGPGALSRPLPPLRPSPFPAPPREGGRLVTNKDALTSEDLRRGAFEHDASRRPSMTRCSSRGIPSDPLLFGFTHVALAPWIPRKAPPAGSCSYDTTRGRIRDPDPPARFASVEQPASEEACWPNTIERGAPTRISAEPHPPVIRASSSPHRIPRARKVPRTIDKTKALLRSAPREGYA